MRSVIKLTADQKSENAIVEGERRCVLQFTAEQRAEKVRIETKRRNAKTSQAAIIRLIYDRHRYRYATRSSDGCTFRCCNAIIQTRYRMCNMKVLRLLH